MTPDSVPALPLGQQTTYELAARRKELEHSIAHLPAGAPVLDLIRQRLGELDDEEAARARLAAANGAP